MQRRFCVGLWALIGAVTPSCAPTAPEPRAAITAQADTGCDGRDSYTLENGDTVECVYTDEPGDDPDPDPGPDPGSGDPCLYFPDLCNPDPGDPCATDPNRCNPPPTGPTCTPAPPPPPQTDVQQQVANRVAHCFQQDWTQEPYRQSQDDGHSTASSNALVRLADWVEENTYVCAVQGLDYLFLGDSAGAQALQAVITHLNQQAAQQGLSPYQQMCSAMCASSSLLQYSSDLMTNVFTTLPSNAVAAGLGECKEFSEIGVRLLQGMGFTASVVMDFTHRHAYVDVTSPLGGSYYMEPQSGVCNFYNPH